jgi:hypothetical protein
MAANTITYIASGTIKPGRIVKTDANNFGVVQAGASETIHMIGVATTSFRRAAGSPFDDGNAAVSGESVAVYGLGEMPVLCEIGAAVTAGDWLVSDTNGRGITGTTDQFAVGQALESGTTLGQRVLIKVQPQQL